MALVELKEYQFTYPDEAVPAIEHIDWTVNSGEFIVICGPSGCGKTTLLRQLKPELRPTGSFSGGLEYEGLPLEEHDPRKLAGEIGFVLQDPENQLVMDHVLAELAFGLENLGMPAGTMRERIAEMVNMFGLEEWLHLPVHELSGGQKQIVNLASVLLLQPKVLLLDEPTAQLDPIAATQFVQLLHRLNQDYGMTVIMTEHRLEELFPLADRIVLMEKGEIRIDAEPSEAIRRIAKQDSSVDQTYLPSLAQLVLAVNGESENERVPLTVKEGRVWFRSHFEPKQKSPTEDEKQSLTDTLPYQQQTMLECRSVTFQYGKHQAPVIKKLDLTVLKGERLTILGGNGAGKSTLLQLMGGLLTPKSGSVRWENKELRAWSNKERNAKIGYLAQNPLLYFVHDTVQEELESAVLRAGGNDTGSAVKMAEWIERLNLQQVLNRHPYDLSGGERQKAALACVLAAGPELLLLDEPTKGMDPISKQRWGELLQQLMESGITIVSVTHDIEFAARFSDRCLLLFDGAVASEGTPNRFFGGHFFYTTSINRIVRETYPDLITQEEVLKRWNLEK